MKLKAVLVSHSAVLAAVVTVIFTAPASVAAGPGSLPPSALPGTRALDTIERREMPRFDVETLLAEDAVRERSGKPVAPRYAKIIQVTYTPDNSGTWETLDDGSRLWRLRLSSPGALSLNLGLERFELPAGAAFWIHAPDGSNVQGPYIAKNRNALGGLWTAVVLGDELVAELRVPAGKEAAIEITAVSHGYRFFGERESGVVAKRGSCNVNVVCPEGNRWADQIRSVARTSMSDNAFQYLCTAQLINNTAEDETPYLYTAGHCVYSVTGSPLDPATLVAYWNYQTATCGDRFGGSLSQNQSGSTLIAASYVSEVDFQFDFGLLLLDESPDPEFDVFFAGWDARDVAPSASVCIHHPGADQKSISFDNDPAEITSVYSYQSPGDGNYLRVIDWDLGTTEGGSSGSCLFDQMSGLCVGSETGGAAACGNDASDWYARLNRQWTGEGTPETRLSDWLDPAGTGAEYLTGKNPGSTSGSQTWLIPSVASLPGAEGSNWKSQISVANSSSSSQNAMVYYVPDGEDWPGELFGGPYLIGPMGSLYLDDPLLPENPTSGLMYIMTDGDDTALSAAPSISSLTVRPSARGCPASS